MKRTALDDPRYYLNRHVEWLEFNRRVLEEARDLGNPLLERVKFLAITANNLDEFVEVRVSSFLQRIEHGSTEIGPDGHTTEQELQIVSSAMQILVRDQYKCWNEELLPALAKQSIRVLSLSELDTKAANTAKTFYDRRVSPMLTPVTVDPSHPFPHVLNKALCLAFLLRKRRGGKLRAWADVAAEIEALLSLASYSYEHPDDPFPEFAEQIPSAPAIFLGEELGHPLIPSAECVRNNVHLDAQTRVLLVSGSNMSGKSTYLRTAGINAVLALAGAPIRGKSLRMTPVQLGTSIRRVDSLQEHRSSFYTEILRIRDVFNLTENSQRVLFLFDELLEGTNSHDRRIGADGLLRALLERGALGIITTHDLALTDTAHVLPGAIRNVHFQDYVEEGKMRFDHKLREGVVAKSNALELMRLIGLKV